jgi:multiple sugar transport system substrate-binding protein
MFRTMTATVLAATTALVALPRAADAQDLTIAGRDGVYAEALAWLVDAYAEANPDVEIERLELPYAGLYERSVIAMREDAGAFDVVMLDDTWATEWMGEGWLADLEALGLSTDGFVDPTVAVSRYPYGDGGLHALPFVGNVELFAYNAAMFEAHGLDRPESWTDVVDAAATIDEAEPAVDGVVFRGVKANPIVTGFLPILWAHGARVVDEAGAAALDSDAAVAALTLYLSLKPYAPEGVELYNSTEVRDALQTGAAAIAIEVWPSWVPALDDPSVSQVVGDVEIIAAPGQVDGPAPMLGAWLLAIPADAPNPELAADFLAFATAPEQQRALALEIGLPPTQASVYEDAAVVEAYRWYPAQLEALRNAQPRPRITQWSEVEAILGDYLQLALIGELSAEEAVSEAHDRIADALGD